MPYDDLSHVCFLCFDAFSCDRVWHADYSDLCLVLLDGPDRPTFCWCSSASEEDHKHEHASAAKGKGAEGLHPA